jgi:hypothetical protein
MAASKGNRPTYTTNFIKGDWDKALYLDNPHVDNLMTAFLGLGAEFWSMRRRMMVLETLLAKGKSVDLAALEAYEPTPEQKVTWEAERDDFIKRTFSVLTRETTAVGSTVPTGKVPSVKTN